MLSFFFSHPWFLFIFVPAVYPGVGMLFVVSIFFSLFHNETHDEHKEHLKY